MQQTATTLLLLTFGCLFGAELLLAQTAENANDPAGEARTKIVGQLQNFRRLSDRVFVGGEPHAVSDFSALAGAGITTLVSVDGAKPHVEDAEKAGLRYIHIPFGYDGIPPEAEKMLAQVMRSVDGNIYFHCHHGKHRGPAAAAIACLADGTADKQRAREILTESGTSPKYAGLWRDVDLFEPPAAGTPLPELVASAEVESLVSAMASIDRARDNLLASQAHSWQATPEHPDMDPAQEALIVREGFSESLRNLPEEFRQDEQLKDWLRSAEAEARRLEAALSTGTAAEANAALKSVESSCQRCHAKYRD